MNFIVNRLCQLQERSGASVAQISAAVGVTESTVRRWLAGTREPSRESIQKLAVFFQVPSSVLIDDEDDVAPTVAMLPRITESGVDLASMQASAYGSLASGIKADYVYEMPDDSMQLLDVRKGDILLIRSRKVPRRNDLVLFRYQGRLLLRCYRLDEPHGVILMRCGSVRFSDLILTREEYESEVEIIGTLVAYRRAYRRI